MRTKSRASLRVIQGALLFVLMGVTACSPQFRNHGYIPPQDELEQVEVGTDTRETVAQKIGVPTSGGVLNDSGYYYVRMRTRTFGPLAPKEIDRQVLAVSFTESGVVENVERFGLERGQVVPLSRRVTTSAVNNSSFLRQLLGNIGQFNPSILGGG
ncbi:MAG: outer membrane protein assembly factor BamE [Sulfitobacter sp.]